MDLGSNRVTLTSVWRLMDLKLQRYSDHLKLEFAVAVWFDNIEWQYSLVFSKFISNTIWSTPFDTVYLLRYLRSLEVTVRRYQGVYFQHIVQRGFESSLWEHYQANPAPLVSHWHGQWADIDAHTHRSLFEKCFRKQTVWSSETCLAGRQIYHDKNTKLTVQRPRFKTGLLHMFLTTWSLVGNL